MRNDMETVRTWDSARNYVERIIERKRKFLTFEEKVATAALLSEEESCNSVRLEIAESTYFMTALNLLCNYAKYRDEADKGRVVDHLLMALEQSQQFATEDLLDEAEMDYRDHFRAAKIDDRIKEKKDSFNNDPYKHAA